MIQKRRSELMHLVTAIILVLRSFAAANVLAKFAPMARKTARRRAAPTSATLAALVQEVRAQRQTLDGCCRDLQIQLTRIAQLQAQLDEIRRAWVKASLGRP
jgi:hypothetical protein